LKKKHTASPSSPRTRLTAEKKETLLAHRNFLLQKWGQELNESPTDWQALFDIHWELYQLERHHPWLKKVLA
jgi:hypothetical protein